METMIACPHCQRADRQVRAGMNGDSQRYKCGHCGRRYTPAPRPRGYPDDLRLQARRLRAEGLTAKEIGLRLGVPTRSVANWVRRPGEGRAESRAEGQPALNERPAPDTAPREAAPGPERPGRRRPTIHDVAERAGVSTSTVSNFLNQQGRMSEATGGRVREAIEALSFTPNFFVRAIRQRRTGILGVLTFGLGDLETDSSLSAPLLQGVNDAADVAEHEILLYTGWPGRAHRYSGLNFLNGHVDGLLWVAPWTHEPILERLAAAGLPVVALLTREVPPGVGWVNADNLEAMRLLVAHLTALGHRRIGYLGPAHTSNYRDRRDGFRQAMADAGLAGEALENPEAETVWDWPVYEAILERWLALPERPTALIASDDGYADYAAQVLHRHGLRVPQDISVTGFNDAGFAKRVCGGLTTIRQPFRRIAQLGGARLIALIGGASAADCRLTVPVELVVRASTGPAPV